MTFTPKDWRDLPEESTPIDAAALEGMERRLAAYSDSIVGAITVPASDYAVNRALSFIESMLEAIEQPAGASTIHAAQDYRPTYLGPVAGTFALRDGTPAESGGHLTGYSVESHVVTDTDYLIESKPANADGTFAFDYAQPGEKRFVLRRDSDAKMLAEFRRPYLNVRSYIVSPGQPGYGTQFVNQSYLYDQAVALLAALAAGRTELAQRLAQGLLNFQTAGGTHDGGFVFSAVQAAPGYGDAAYRTGAHAIGLYALLAYHAAFPNDTSRDFAGATTRAILWMAGQFNAHNLLTGGWGTYTPNDSGGQDFDPAVKLTWMSAEHNFDAFHAFNLAAATFDPGWAFQANTIATSVQTELWDVTRGRFLQGMKEDGTPDAADPLDCHSWAAIFCWAIGDHDRAATIMEPAQLAPYVFTRNTPEGIPASGYSVNYDEPGYPGAVPTVWSEGTFGVAYAFARMGLASRWQQTMAGIVPAQAADGSYYYVTDSDPSQDLFPYRSTIGASWSILAACGHGIWGVPGNR